MEIQKEIKKIEFKLLNLSAELISLLPEDNEIIKIKKDYYKDLMIALKIIKNQQEDLEQSDIMRHCN
jgi:hypothetical protein